MTDRAALLAAIEALEKATEGSRELDCRVALITKIGNFNTSLEYSDGVVQLLLDNCKGWEAEAESGEKYFHQANIDIPHFTTSLDAALTLVPEGWAIDLGFLPDANDATAQLWNGKHAPDIIETQAAKCTLALALCLAAMRARLEGE